MDWNITLPKESNMSLAKRLLQIPYDKEEIEKTEKDESIEEESCNILI